MKKNELNHEFPLSLENVVGVEEASHLWGLSAGYIKNLCADGKIASKKIGKTWVIDKNQMNPKIHIIQGEKIKSLRLENELTQSEFSSKVGNIPISVLNRIETGRRKLTVIQEMAICKAFNLPNDYFQNVDMI